MIPNVIGTTHNKIFKSAKNKPINNAIIDVINIEKPMRKKVYDCIIISHPFVVFSLYNK